MKKRCLIAVTAAAVLLSACIPSLKPFYTEKDVVFEAGLLGEWRANDAKEDQEVWKFEKTDGKAYQLTTVEKDGRQGSFKAHLFKLKQEYFLDLIPVKIDYATNQASLAACAMHPGHLLFRVPQIAPELKIAATDYVWLGKFLKANPKSLAHHGEEDDGILLTADTKSLQGFVLQHLGERELFCQPSVLVRQ